LHVTLRLVAGLPVLRRRGAFKAVRAAIQRGRREGFAVVHFSVMTNHVHLIVEANDKRALSRGMQGLKISIAKRLNHVWGKRKGAVFSERYHAREISTPTQARNTLLYVLSNARKHAAERGASLPTRWVDPFSSARQFDGWRQHVRLEPGVVAPPASWLLRIGWMRGRVGIDAHVVPSGPAPWPLSRTLRW
jgi:REP element-mobilizing transposase RayT